jgi:hypothetical protein
MAQRGAWLLGLSIATASCKGGCDFVEAVAGRAGARAIDCGHVQLNADATAVNACVQRSLDGGLPFYAIYEQVGLDSHVASGVARSADGTVTIFSYDGDPGGGGGDGRPVIDAQVCEGAKRHVPAIGDPAAPFPLACASLGPSERLCARNEAA